jgi:hypothetical protein
LCPACVGAAFGVLEGFAVAKLTGSDYTWKDAAVDAALGAVGAGLVDKLNDLRKADNGLVYLRTNLKTGEEYVGRSKSEAAFLNRKAAHDSKLGTRHQYTVLDKAENGTPLRVAEESAIRQRGGPGKLANKRYEMNDEAYRAAGGTVPKP